jgi:hypothetical protein
MKSITSHAMLQRFRFIFLLIILTLLLFILATKIVHPVEYPNSDFFTFWLSSHLVASGQNPYSTTVWVGGHHQFGATWIPNATFIYPLPITYLFIALGQLPLYQAFIVWVFLSEAMIIVSLSLLLRLFPKHITERFVLPLTIGMILFRPTIVTLVNGQLSGFLLFVIVCIVCFWEKGKWRQGGILLPLLVLKPNLGVPIIALLSLYLIIKNQIIPLIMGATSGMVLLLTGFLLNPNWIIEFWQAGNTKLSQIFGFAPTIWGLSSFFCKHRLDCSLAYGGAAIFLLLLGFSFLLARKLQNTSPLLAASIAVTVTLLITPTAWPYDQLLLVIPIVTIIMDLAGAGSNFFLVALTFLALDVMAFILLGISATMQAETLNAVIPLSIFGLLAWILAKPGLVSSVSGIAPKMSVRH